MPPVVIGVLITLSPPSHFVYIKRSMEWSEGREPIGMVTVDDLLPLMIRMRDSE